MILVEMCEAVFSPAMAVPGLVLARAVPLAVLMVSAVRVLFHHPPHLRPLGSISIRMLQFITALWLAAAVGVVLTSLTTSTLSGSPATPPVVANSIPAALDQIRNPANVLVAVVFGLSPGLVFSRFRQNVEQTKRELTRTSGATSVQSKRGT